MIGHASSVNCGEVPSLATLRAVGSRQLESRIAKQVASAGAHGEEADLFSLQNEQTMGKTVH